MSGLCLCAPDLQVAVAVVVAMAAAAVDTAAGAVVVVAATLEGEAVGLLPQLPLLP